MFTKTSPDAYEEYKKDIMAGEMAQWVKFLDIKSDTLSLIFETHTIEGQN